MRLPYYHALGGGHYRVVIKQGWSDEGRVGTAIVQLSTSDGMLWTAVIWDDDPGDPDWHKASGLEYLQ